VSRNPGIFAGGRPGHDKTRWQPVEKGHFTVARASCPRLGCVRVFARGQAKKILKNPGIVHLLLDKPQKKE
jgi:hypothetical protein